MINDREKGREKNEKQHQNIYTYIYSEREQEREREGGKSFHKLTLLMCGTLQTYF